MKTTKPIHITGDIQFMTQRQGGLIVSQCMECGQYVKLETPLSIGFWHMVHREVCKGDDGSDGPIEDVTHLTPSAN